MIKTFTKKILPLSLLLISFLIPVSGIQAQIIGAPGTCSVTIPIPQVINEANCTAAGGKWTPSGSGTTGGPIIVSPPGSCSIPFFNSPGACTQNSGIWCTSPKIPKDGACVTPSTSSGSASKSTYNFLAPLKCADGVPGCVNGKLVSFDPAGDKPLSKYLNIMIKIVIGIAAVLAMIMIVVGGIQYMTSELISSKEEGKKRISNAILGLIIALGSYVLLFMVNPDLLKVEPGLEGTALTYITPEELGVDAPLISTPIGNLSSFWQRELNNMFLPAGARCPRSGGRNSIRDIATSFMGKVTYNNSSQSIMRTAGPAGTMYSDCSNFVNTVLACAGITPRTGNHTMYMKQQGEAITGAVEIVNGEGYINGRKLNPGDLVGLNNSSGHHVWIYIGNGEMLDSQVGGGTATKPGPTGRSVNSIERLKKTMYSGMNLDFVVRY